MINRLIAVVLCLFGMVAWVQATPNVTAEITYDLAVGRADYYFWNEEESAGNNAYMWYECSYPNLQQTCTNSGNISTVQIYLTEQRSGMRWPLKLKGFKEAYVEGQSGCTGHVDKTHLQDSHSYVCTVDGDQPNILLIKSFLHFTLNRQK